MTAEEIQRYHSLFASIPRVVAISLVSAIIALAVDGELRRRNQQPSEGRAPDVTVGLAGDALPAAANFVAIGQAYPGKLGDAYAAAWTAGADRLDAGSSVSAALAVVASTWTTKRSDLFETTITPALSAIVSESTRDVDITTAERAALAAAWRGLARGMNP